LDAFPFFVNHTLAVFLNECTSLRGRQDVEHNLGRAAQAYSLRCHHEGPIDKDGMLEHRVRWAPGYLDADLIRRVR